MAKEIHEQPEVVGHTLAHYVDMAAMRLKPFAWPVDPKALSRISIVGCGTAYMAGLVGKYWIERFARLPVEIDVASEYRYREAPVERNGLTIVISQSGETADTLASLRYVKDNGSKTVGVVNVPTSSIARLTDAAAPTLAGPEIGVASTKAFTCQLAAMACLAISLGRARGAIDEATEAALLAELVLTPGLLAEALKLEPAVEALAHAIARARDVLYLGRGTAYPLALEGALKLKELSYIHAEGYAAGELKHGPIALIDEAMPVIVIAPRDAVFEKTVSNMQEVAARGGRIMLIGEKHAAEEAAVAIEHFLPMPDMGAEFRPDRLCRPDPDARLSYGRHHGQRRRPAAQSGQIGDRGVVSARPALNSCGAAQMGEDRQADVDRLAYCARQIRRCWCTSPAFGQRDPRCLPDAASSTR